MYFHAFLCPLRQDVLLKHHRQSDTKETLYVELHGIPRQSSSTPYFYPDSALNYIQLEPIRTNVEPMRPGSVAVSTCRRRQEWHRAPKATTSSNSSKTKSSSEALLQRSRSVELDSTVSAKATECHGMPWVLDGFGTNCTSDLQIFWT